MINREEFNRALRLTIVILVVALFILGFLWINFLYSRFNVETEAFQQATEAGIVDSIEDKVQVVVRQADLLYEEETKLLHDVMTNRMNVIKSNLFDYGDLPSELLGYRLIDDARQFHDATGIKEVIISDKHNLQIGGLIDRSVFELREFEQKGNMLYYSEYSATSRSNIQLSVDQYDYLRARIKKWIRDYMELEPNLILLDQSGQSLADTVEVTDAFREEHYVAFEESALSGYTFGFYRPKSELQNLLSERQAMFQRFLNNHLIEIAAFLVLLIVTLAVFFGLIARQHNVQLTALNDEIIQRYREPETTEGELYREYGLSRSIDSLVADAQKNRQYTDMIEQKHKKELKQSRIEFLQMERRYEYLLSKESKEQFTRFTPMLEQIDLSELITQAHHEFDPEAEMKLIAGGEIIESDPAILQTLVESFFRLSEHPHRHYRVEYLVDQEFVKLFLTLEHPGVVDPSDIERIKYLSGLLGGIVLRLHQADEKFTLVLRLLNQ